ncbi:hypothetical protein Q4567_11630 [Aliiglaciecola sp. 2_MG-2023]|uniref:hypothetical protein n=1 Tax=unclassified Aliiglaciecola TaxID=2593648 RepID=UPI0026E2C5D5|nr:MULTISPECIES: hypothetical protein [unclassified Aliiglaciecola]MDO6711376.1 hypothetical protein [Aliiglaciecola sp. 2_MG-2023]MDO6752175.1 hypothetical protein [Aliiglaciecola sp. 1_MG-2023]
MKYIVVSLVVICSFYSKLSLSENLFSYCDSCVSEYDFETKARFDAIDHGGSMNTVTVVNRPAAQHKKYRVINIITQEPGVPPSVHIITLVPTTDEIQKVSTLLDLWGAAKISALDVTIPSEIADSAYDVVKSNKSNDVMDYAIENRTFEDYLNYQIYQIMDMFYLTKDYPYILDITFSDGSTAKISFNGSLSGEFIEMVDSQNNTINQTSTAVASGAPVELSGETNVNNYLEAINRLNIPVTINGGGTGSGISMTCSSKETETGLTVTCKVH